MVAAPQVPATTDGGAVSTSSRTLLAQLSTGAWLVLTAAPGRAAATTETVVTRTPVEEVVSLVCVDEPVLVSGYTQTTTHLTTDGNGGTVFVQASTFAALRGTGQVSGQTYQSVGQPFGAVLRSGGPFPVVETRATTANIIRVGQPDPGLAFRVHILEHVTVDANGTVTAEVVDFRAECF
jgi:hypothetical protein